MGANPETFPRPDLLVALLALPWDTTRLPRAPVAMVVVRVAPMEVSGRNPPAARTLTMDLAVTSLERREEKLACSSKDEMQI